MSREEEIDAELRRIIRDAVRHRSVPSRTSDAIYYLLQERAQLVRRTRT